MLISGGEFLLRQGELGEVFLDRMFYLGWSIIFYLLVLSNLITGFSTFYRSPEVAFLFTLPVDAAQIFKVKFTENLVYSSWAILILGIPMTLAYGELQGLSSVGYVTVFLTGILPFLFIATVAASLMLVILVLLSRFFKMRTLFISLGLLFTGAFYLYFTVSQQDTVVGGQLGNFRALGRYMANLSSTPFPFIPSYWLSKLFLDGETLGWVERLYFASLFITTALVGWEASLWIARRSYFSSYQIMERTGSGTIKKGSNRIFSFNMKGVQGHMKGLIAKDVVQFLRTPQQWVQFLLMGFFITIYLINLSRGRVHFHDLLPFWQNAIYVFNFGFTGFIMAALTARFVYPMVSMEGRSLWILLASPFSIRQIFQEKFWFAFFTLFTLAEVVVMASNYFLGLQAEIAVIASGFMLMTSLSLISLSIGLGTVYAQFDEPNPMKVSSGYGGIIAIVLSLIYVSFSVFCLVIVIRQYQIGGSPALIGSVVAFVVILTVLYTWLPLRWGLRALSTYEP